MSKTPEDYIVKVSCGPDYDKSKLKQINPNDELNPTLVEGPLFTGYVSVRMVNFDGLAPPDTTVIRNCASGYFKGKHRRYSIMVQGRFAEEINGNDIVFGIDADVPSKLPTGIGLAIKIAKWLDPAVEADVYSSKPYIYSPLLCSMNSIGVFPVDSTEISDNVQVQTGTLLVEEAPVYRKSVSPKSSKDIGKWSFHSRMIPEDVRLLIESRNGVPATESAPPSAGGWFGKKKDKKSGDSAISDKKNLGSYEKRKKHFADLTNRESVTISPEHVYCMDFYDAYFDINTISLKLPGISLSAFKYWEGQPLRFVAKSRTDPSKVYFTVWFEILERSLVGVGPSVKCHNDEEGSSLKPPLTKKSFDCTSMHQVPEDIIKSAVEEEKLEIIGDGELAERIASARLTDDDDESEDDFKDAIESPAAMK